MPSKSRLVSKAFSRSGVLSTIAAENPTVDTGTTQIANVDALPTSGNDIGDQLFIEATNRLYIWNGSGWYNIALINTSPTWDSGGQPASSYELDVDSPQDATIITLAASDAEGLPIQYSYVTSGSMDSMATISQDSSVFTITPKTFDEVGGEVELIGSITFRASDGINILPNVSSFVLNFVFTVENSKYTTLLLEAVDTSDNNNIIDSSSNNHAITVTGDVKAGTFSPYRHGGYSTYFDGSGDYLSVPDDASLDLGTGDFTLEAWVRMDSTSGNRIIFERYTSGNNASFQLYYRDTGNSLAFWTADGGGVIAQDPSSSTIKVGFWHHIVATRESGTLKLYIDGSQVASASCTTNFDSTLSLTVGAQVSTGTNYFHGYISDCRIVKGTAVYTSNFTTPAARLTAITNTSLLTCHLPYITDGSTNNHAITVNGNTSTRAFSPYDSKKYSATSHGGSVYFDGNADYLTIPASDDFRQDQGDWTIDGWFYFESFASNTCTLSLGSYQGIDNFTTYITTSGAVGYEAGNGTSWAALANYNSPNNLVSLNTWNHIAWVRSSGSLFIYLNGTRILNQASASFGVGTSGNLYIGNYFGQATTNSGPHYQSDLRIIKGTALYTGDSFSVPTAPLSSSGAELHIKGTDASIIDKSQQGGNISLASGIVGDSATAVHTNSKSINFMADDDIYCTFYNPSTFSGEFTIEFWYNLASLLNGSGSNVNNNYHTILNLGNSLIIRWGDTGFGNYLHFITASGFPGIDILPKKSDWIVGTGWHHFAATRDASNYNRYYWDGSLMNIAFTNSVGNANPDINHDFNSASSLRAGTFGAVGNASIGTGFRGYLQDLRITNGLVRYTGNFTPPTEPLLG